MSTTKSVEFEKIDGTNTTTPITRPDELSGRVRVAFFSHTAESEASGSTIKLTKLPKGARILAIATCAPDLGGAGATIAIGDADDTDRFVAAFDVGTAATAWAFRTMRTPTTEEPDIGFGYRLTADTEILATTATDALNTALLFGMILYVLD